MYDTIDNETEDDNKISIILLKLLNETFECGLLYRREQLELITTTGNFDFNKISNINVLSIPIFKHGLVKYHLNLLSNKRVKINKSRTELIELLTKYLI